MASPRFIGITRRETGQDGALFTIRKAPGHYVRSFLMRARPRHIRPEQRTRATDISNNPPPLPASYRTLPVPPIPSPQIRPLLKPPRTIRMRGARLEPATTVTSSDPKHSDLFRRRANSSKLPSIISPIHIAQTVPPSRPATTKKITNPKRVVSRDMHGDSLHPHPLGSPA